MKNRHLRENIIKYILFAAALFSVLVVLLITIMIFVNALPAFREIGIIPFLTGTTWAPTAANPSYGLLPMIIGSAYITGLAILIGLPIGFAVAVFLAELAKGKLAVVLRRAVEMLAAIPSVIYGFFGLVMIVPIVQKFGGTGLSVLSAGIILAIMILPTLITVFEVSLRAVPREFKEGSLALGASHWETIIKVITPAAKSGLFTGVVLGIGRAIGETMAVILVAGNIPVIPDSVLSAARTMTVNIIMDMGYVQPGSLHYSALFATGAILFVFIMILNFTVQYVSKKVVKL